MEQYIKPSMGRTFKEKISWFFIFMIEGTKWFSNQDNDGPILAITYFLSTLWPKVAQHSNGYFSSITF